jgi:hypothetical protein
MTEVIGGIAQVMGLGRDVALLIDGDNIPSRFAGQVITQAVRLGSVTVKRVYGRIGGLTDWQGSTGFRLIHGGTGKNAADMQLTIDAVELFHRGYRSFVICSSDHDFTPLAHYLGENGAKVLGVGDGRTTEDFRKACTRFEFILLEAENTPSVTNTKFSKVDTRIQEILTLHAGPGGTLYARIAGLLGRDDALKKANLVEKNWRQYLEAHPHLFSIDPKGPNARVRWIGGSV